MKIPFKDAIGKNDLLHIALMNCLTPEVIDSAREKEEYEVRLVVNGVDLDPTTLNLFQDKAEEWVETRAKEIAAEKFHEAAKAAEDFSKMVNDIKFALIEKYGVDVAEYE
jgi:ribosome biogenesis GTPase A